MIDDKTITMLREVYRTHPARSAQLLAVSLAAGRDLPNREAGAEHERNVLNMAFEIGGLEFTEVVEAACREREIWKSAQGDNADG